MSKIVPVEAARRKVFDAMSPQGQAVAKSIEEKLSKQSKGVAIIWYDIGAMVDDMVKNPLKYGGAELDTVKQISEYLNMGLSALHDARNFSIRFTREHVVEYAGRPMANGHHLTLQHWLVLTRLGDQKDQEALMKRILSESLSGMETRDAAKGMLRKNLRKGGRKVKPPASPVQGITRLAAISGKFRKYMAVTDEHVFSILDGWSPDLVTTELADKLQSCRDELVAAETTTHERIVRIDESLTRVKKVLELRAASDAEAGAVPEEAPVTPPKRVTDKKPPKTAAPAVASAPKTATKKAGKKVPKKAGKKPALQTA